MMQIIRYIWVALIGWLFLENAFTSWYFFTIANSPIFRKKAWFFFWNAAQYGLTFLLAYIIATSKNETLANTIRASFLFIPVILIYSIRRYRKIFTEGDDSLFENKPVGKKKKR